MAVDVFEGESSSGEPAEAQLARILREANRRIYELAVTDDSHRGMGTTLTAAKVTGDEVSIGHVGDSRAYRLREGELEQLTSDHSLVAELERTGQITPEAAEHHPQRSIITRALGPEPDVQVDTYTLAGRDGDVFLLCSDGLTSMVSDEELSSIVRLRGDARRGRRVAGARRQPERRQGQHHGRDVPARGAGSRRRRPSRGGDTSRTRRASLAAEDETIAGQITAAEVAQAAREQLGEAPPDATMVVPPPERPAPPAAPPRRRRRARVGSRR